MDENYCQSCGMPMGTTDEHYGTEKDGTKSKDYCSHCYEDGSFKYDATMDEMIKICTPFVVAANPEMNEATATKMMEEFFPNLKRWQK